MNQTPVEQDGALPEPAHTDDIVRRGLCIGCGLCAAIAGPERLQMAWTPEGRLRPVSNRDAPLDTPTMQAINAACPGVRVAGITTEEASEDAYWDDVWGWMVPGFLGWAGDPDVRHLSSTGGALNALAIHLLETEAVRFILHVGPDPDLPTRSRWRLSRTRDDVLGSGGSRYGPTSPLEGVDAALATGEDFAFVGKPCDISAMRLRARDDLALAESCKLRLALVCGGQSEFRKTADLLKAWDVAETAVTELRYRGRGNPGPTTATTSDGIVRSMTYLELWEDETSWALPHRCKVCPDAIGMAADVIAADCWPGGAPVGEDEGINAIAARSRAGQDLFASAISQGALFQSDPIGFDDWSNYQPHQLRKRQAVWARLVGQEQISLGTLTTENLGLRHLARQQNVGDLLNAARGTAQRGRDGRIAEPTPTAATRNGAPTQQGGN